MSYDEMPALLERLQSAEGGEIAKLALEFLILTVSRTGEVLGARWAEIDLADRTWTIPANRMKARREHRVPLCTRAVEILERAKELGCSAELVFPGRVDGRPMSN